MESDMAALALNVDSNDEGNVSETSSSEKCASSFFENTPPPSIFSGNDDDIAGQLLSILAEEMSQKKRKRNLKTAGPSTTGIRHRKVLALALPEDDLKREKNRDSVKRSYYRKIETLDELRQHTEDLREQYMTLLAQWENKTEKEKVEAASTPSSLIEKYLELARWRDRLWMENTQLQEQFDDQEKITYRFQRLFDINYQLMNRSFAAPMEQADADRRVQTPMLIMNEMSFESFNVFAQEAQRTFETFLASRHCMVTTETALGWTCSHVAKDNSFGYYFEKSFQPNSYKCVSEVVRTAWQTLTSPEKHSKLSLTITAMCCTVQWRKRERTRSPQPSSS
uniref:BZIP domain-containing protein n=1 Tax=Hyaloperonospora arabidopsidis (strain Emoy2) TaxID=559515 RepID=M4C037_HYAAE